MDQTNVTYKYLSHYEMEVGHLTYYKVVYQETKQLLRHPNIVNVKTILEGNINEYLNFKNI